MENKYKSGEEYFKDVPQATQDQLERYKIDPKCPFASIERKKGDPFVIRIGDTRVSRSEYGGVTESFGYYGNSHAYMCQILGEKFREALAPIMNLDRESKG